MKGSMDAAAEIWHTDMPLFLQRVLLLLPIKSKVMPTQWHLNSDKYLRLYESSQTQLMPLKVNLIHYARPFNQWF